MGVTAREGVGAVTRSRSVVCPKHGPAFDACEGSCDTGEVSIARLYAVYYK